MDVGQVTFSINAKGLDKTLSAVTTLEQKLNGMDGRVYGTGATKASKQAQQRTKDEKAYNRAVQKSLRNQAALERQNARFANEEIKRRNLGLKERFKTAQRIAKLEREQAASYAKFQKSTQQTMVNVGAQMQTLGATLQRVTSPFMNVYTGFTRMAGYMLFGKVIQGVTNAFSRYDTINTYAKSLELLGMTAKKKFSIGANEATTAIKNLEASVLGLPTGLDEIVASMRKYAGATGDVERATKLAIAANNAYIAGSMDDRQKLFTERQLLSLAGGAELGTNQWDSLRRNAPLAIRAVADEMHMGVQSMITDLKTGKISGQEFLDVFINVGTTGKLKNAAEVMKQTWGAVGQNIQNALNRAGEGILNSLDTIFKKMDGRTFLQHILGVDKNGKDMGDGLKHVIDDLSSTAQEWIKANPEKILSFFKNLENIDWKGIAGGFAEMGLWLGRMYSFFAKFLGGNFIKTMIFVNILGKIIQTAGGLIKGLALPASHLIRFLAFGKLAKAGAVSKTFGGLAKAGAAAKTMALSWQGIAAYATTIAAIPAIAWSLKEVALALQEFSKVKFSASLINNMMLGITAVSLLGTFVAAVGSFLASNPVGWAAIAGSAAGTMELAGLSKTMKWMGEGLNAIATAEIPDIERLRYVMETMNEVGKYFRVKSPIEAIGKMFDSWSKTAEFKAIGKMGDAFSAITQIATFELPKGWAKKSIKRVNDMADVVSTFETAFADMGSRISGEKGRNSRNGMTASTETIGAKIETFAHSVEHIGGIMTNMVTIVDNAMTLNKRLDKLVSKMPPSATKGENNTALFSQATEGIKQITAGLYNFLKEPGYDGKFIWENLSEVSRAFSQIHMGNIKNQLNYIPEMISSIISINKQLAATTRGLVNTGGSTYLTSVSDKLKPIFEDIGKLSGIIPTNLGGLKKLKSINSALKKVKTTFDRLKELSGLDAGGIDLSSIETLASKIKEALASLEEVGEKKVEIELKADIKGQDDVVKDVKKQIDVVKKRIQNLDAFVRKQINVALSERTVGITGAVEAAKAGINAAMSAIKSIPSTVNKPITVNTNPGGHVPKQFGGKARVFRANGGSIRRGTDSVEALLTPGEWVMNRHATSMLGDDVLSKLNRLDVRGALDSLSLRAGQIQSRTINNNSTKNANVTVNNYHSDGVGYSRAGRFVRAL